jgi:hypothetical protein
MLQYMAQGSSAEFLNAATTGNRMTLLLHVLVNFFLEISSE